MTYQLHFYLRSPVEVTVGKLGSFAFPSGEYVYTGSGGRSVQARVARHFSKSKKLRWHIDYLISNPMVEIIESRLFAEMECSVNKATEGVVLVGGFGSTDCRNGCGSHLKYLG